MISAPGGVHAVLQRRGNLATALQALVDGLAITVVALWLVDLQIGVLTAEYTIMLMLLMGSLAAAFDHYAIYRSNLTFTVKALRLLKSWVAAFAFLVVIAFATKQSEYYSRLLAGQLFLAGYFAQLLLHLAARMLQLTVLKHIHVPDNALVIGTGRLANHLYQKISGNPWMDQQIVGCVSIEDGAVLPAPAVVAGEAPCLGGLADIDQLIARHKVHTVYFVTPLGDSEVIEKLYFQLLDRHVAVHWIPDIFSLRLINHSVSEIAGLPVLTLSETPLTGTRLVMKTVEDFVLASLILILVAPLLLLVAAAIKLDSPGPVFFRQQRMGWNGRIFCIWKFRSMVVHEAANGVVKQAEKNDPRVTRVGAFIRRTSIDELPQLFNVLTGDMSLVGPRPHAIQHDLEYSRRIADYFARHNIKPGITGLAQVRGLRGETRDIEQMIQRVEADIEYINNWSLWLDLVILMRTSLVLTGKHAY